MRRVLQQIAKAEAGQGLHALRRQMFADRRRCRPGALQDGYAEPGPGQGMDPPAQPARPPPMIRASIMAYQGLGYSPS